MTKVNDIEGVLAERPGARQLGEGQMSLELVLSPWRSLGAEHDEPGNAHVVIEMDLDAADAWLQTLDVGDYVRVIGNSLVVGKGANHF